MIVQSSVSFRMTVNENAVTGGPSFSRWPPEPIFRLRLNAKDMFIFFFYKREKQPTTKEKTTKKKGKPKMLHISVITLIEEESHQSSS